MAFATNTNTRVFYAMQGVAVGDLGATGVVDSWEPGESVLNGDTLLMIVHGLQSCGITTNFNLEEIFELGQLSLYNNREDVPDIEVTMERLLDGYSLLYHLGTVDASTPTLTGRGDARADVRLAVGLTTDTSVRAGNSGVAELYCSGMYVNSVSYNLSTDGNFTESVTFVGNDKEWLSGNDGDGLLVTAGTVIDAFAEDVFGNDAPVTATSNVLRRENVVIGSDGITLGGTVFRTVVPSFIEGASPGATGVEGPGGTGLSTLCSYITSGGTLHLNSFSVSVELSREQINELGTRLPYNRYPSFPVSVSTELEVTAVGGDNIDALSSNASNVSDHSIQIVLDDSTVIQLGNKNKVNSVSWGGGDTGGGNATISYSMSNSNDFVVLHSGDPINLTADNYFKNWF